jgi:hypothetical protein
MVVCVDPFEELDLGYDSRSHPDTRLHLLDEAQKQNQRPQRPNLKEKITEKGDRLFGETSPSIACACVANKVISV